jgi:hypothetical protein
MTGRKVALVDRVIKGKDHFYSSWLASAAIGPVHAFFVEIIVTATIMTVLLVLTVQVPSYALA